MVRTDRHQRASLVQDVRELAAYETGKARPCATSNPEQDFVSTCSSRPLCVTRSSLPASSLPVDHWTRRSTSNESKAETIAPQAKLDAAQTSSQGKVITAVARVQIADAAHATLGARPRRLNRLYLQPRGQCPPAAAASCASSNIPSRPDKGYTNSAAAAADGHSASSNALESANVNSVLDHCHNRSGLHSSSSAPLCRRLMPVNLHISNLHRLRSTTTVNNTTTTATSSSCYCYSGSCSHSSGDGCANNDCASSSPGITTSALATVTDTNNKARSCSGYPLATDTAPGMYSEGATSTMEAIALPLGTPAMDAAGCGEVPYSGGCKDRYCLCTSSSGAGNDGSECSVSIAAEEEPQVLLAPEMHSGLSAGLRPLNPLVCEPGESQWLAGDAADGGCKGSLELSCGHQCPEASSSGSSKEGNASGDSVTCGAGAADTAGPSPVLPLMQPDAQAQLDMAAPQGVMQRPPSASASSCRVSMKLHSSHVEDIRPGTLLSLTRLLVPYNWVLTGFAVRSGCIELVLDYTHIDGLEKDEDMGPAGAAAPAVGTMATSSIPPAVDNSNLANDAIEGSSSCMAAAARPPNQALVQLLSYLEHEGLVNPALEPRVAAQVDHQVQVLEWQQDQEPQLQEQHGVHLQQTGAWQCRNSAGLLHEQDGSSDIGPSAAAAAAVTGLAPVVEPVCIVLGPHGTTVSTCGGSCWSSSPTCSTSIQEQEVLLCAGVTCAGAAGCSVRCMGRFLPVTERQRLPAKQLLQCGDSSGGLNGAAEAAAVAAATAVGVNGEVFVLGIPSEQLPRLSAVLQVEVQWRAPVDTTPGMPYTTGITTDPTTSTTSEEQQSFEGLQPAADVGGQYLSAAAPVLLLRACSSCAAAPKASSTGGGNDCADNSCGNGGVFVGLGAAVSTGCLHCGGVWTHHNLQGVARELAGLQASIAANMVTAAGVSTVDGSPAVGEFHQAGPTTTAEATAAACDAAMEFLFDLGSLVDTYPCIMGVELDAHGSKELTEGHVGSPSGVTSQHGPPACQSFTGEVRAVLLEQLGLVNSDANSSKGCQTSSDYLSNAGVREAASSADKLNFSSSTAMAFRRHLADTAVTLLAGCGGLSLPFTARLVMHMVSAAPSRLQLGEVSVLVQAAAEGDPLLEARLTHMLQQQHQHQPALHALPPVQGQASQSPHEGGAMPPFQSSRVLLQGHTPQQLHPEEYESSGCAAVTSASGKECVGGCAGSWLTTGAVDPSPVAGGVATHKVQQASSVATRRTSTHAVCGGGTVYRRELLRELCGQVVICFTGYASPAMERAFWVDTAARMQATYRLYALMTLAFVSLSALRSYLEDGTAAALFMVLYQGGQAALLAMFGLWGDGRPSRLFAAVVSAWLLRVACHLALVRGLAPLPSFVLPVCRAWVDVFNEGGAKSVFEQLPTWLFVLLMGLELPTGYIFYEFLDGRAQGQSGLLTRNVPARLAVFASLKVGVTLGMQAVRRRRFQARLAASKAE
ncbi:hypothetical protein Agub_g2912 [Astrephomene gubernaculifera]|uniref:Uncharacterized protein n=1 Tax=Astrephomene gubernaculifera TaxID=47775 RepID=A0AAD3DK88_9CHLO|nr:hypothetical protein Agub_g2912 [Astrephomene gubernaculifera]